jgi:anti-sigma B factor antagonist
MEDVVGVDIQEREGDVVVARLTGELDIAVAQAVGSRIAAGVPSSARGLVVDMTALDFIDSSGVSMLFGLARQVGQHRQRLHLVAPEGRAVARVLEIVEFGRAAPVYRDVDTAVAEIATPPEPQPPLG